MRYLPPFPRVSRRVRVAGLGGKPLQVDTVGRLCCQISTRRQRRWPELGQARTWIPLAWLKPNEPESPR